jgi:hypothetical protein
MRTAANRRTARTTWGFSYDDIARRTPRLLQIRDSRGLIE